MDHSKATAGQSSSIEELLKHYNIDDFAQFPTTKKFLLANGFDKGGTKRDIVNLMEDVAKGNRSACLHVIKEFVAHVSKETLTKISNELSQPCDDSSSDSSSFFSDEPEIDHCSQAMPDVSSYSQ